MQITLGIWGKSVRISSDGYSSLSEIGSNTGNGGGWG